MMYHFDYLTLLLAGALDAQARVAAMAYNLNLPRTQSSFYNSKFRKALKRNGAKQLYELVVSQEFADIHTMLSELRNLIHGAALKTFTLFGGSIEPETLIEAPNAVRQSLLDAADRLGGRTVWGLSVSHLGVLIEPYSYAATLVDKACGLINKVASATDVLRLFPDSSTVPELTEGAPRDRIFDQGERLAILG